MTEHPFNNDSTPAERIQVHKDTMHGRAIAEANEAGGRFKTVNETTVIGATSLNYPELPSNSPFHHDPVPIEPALGISVEDHQPVGTYSEVQQSLERLGMTGIGSSAPDGGAVAAPASVSASFPDVVETAAPPTPTTDNSDDEPPRAA